MAGSETTTTLPVSRRTLLAGLAAGAAAPAAGLSAAPLSPALHPDAALIELDRQAERMRVRWGQCPDDDESDAIADAMWNLEQAALAIPAQTVDGVLVKLRLLVPYVIYREAERNGPTPDSDPQTVILWNVVRDAERMLTAGRPAIRG